MVLRSKTIDLFQTGMLSQIQRENSELNLCEIQGNIIELNSFPRRIVFELTNACNLNCIMCGRSATTFKKTVMNPSSIQWFAPLFSVVEEVTLFGWGEPTVSPYFGEILKYLSIFPVRKYFITNGTRLKEIEDLLFDCQVDIMAVSLDGACASTNNRLRVGSDFDQIIKNLKAVVDRKKTLGVNYPYINFVFTAMNSNLSELPELTKIAHQVGLDEVKVVYFTAFSEKLISETLWNQTERIREVFDEAIEVAEHLGIRIKLPHLQGEDPSENAFHKPCYTGWRDFFVGSDGYVRPCQSTTCKLFSLKKYETFKEMWNSPELVNFRAKVNNQSEMPEECKRCYQSSFANWNRKEAFIQVGQKFAPIWQKK